MNIRLIVLNANNGAFVNILATLPTSRFECMEDESVATQGLQFKSPIELPVAFVTTFTVTFGSEPLQVPNFATYDHFRKPFGYLAQGVSGAFNYRAADQIFAARSNGAAGTTLRFIEYE